MVFFGRREKTLAIFSKAGYTVAVKTNRGSAAAKALTRLRRYIREWGAMPRVDQHRKC